MYFLLKREAGYKLLSGRGLELGAFEHPAKLPSTCQVEYVDRITTEEAAKLFPEVKASTLPRIQHVLDIDQQGLRQFPDDSYDFFIFNHVIEHLVNPIRAMREIFRVIKPGGCLAIAAPDKDYTFDKQRPLTSFDTLRDKFQRDVSETTPFDYYDVAAFNHPYLLKLSREELVPHLKIFESRREHLSIWTSETFRQFFAASLPLIGVSAKPRYEVFSNENRFEYFGIWEKQSPSAMRAAS